MSHFLIIALCSSTHDLQNSQQTFPDGHPVALLFLHVNVLLNVVQSCLKKILKEACHVSLQNNSGLAIYFYQTIYHDMSGLLLVY